MKKKILALMGVGMGLVFALTGCGAPPDEFSGEVSDSWFDEVGGSQGNFLYDRIVEQGFHNVSESPSSYFSLDRNTAGYAHVRAQLNMHRKIAADSVRTEELVNYFSYEFPAPEAGEGVRASAYLSDCPWNEGHKLVTVGVRTEERKLDSARNNYVFLIDVSGSMSQTVRGLSERMTCLGLVQYGVGKLVDGLGENDAVSVVTYANGVKTELEPTLCDENGKAQIKDAVNALDANGATYGSGGLNLAYENAERYRSENGNNRVILLTDGDFNVGIQGKDELTEFIRTKAESGIYLSVIGVGMGNMRDDLMQTLALNGNGNYAYIDTPREAEKVLGEELNGMLCTVAKDAKAGITFNADSVRRYRLLGYDMKLLSEDDFNDPEKDAGEIGSNLTAVAVYEIETAEGAEAGAELAEALVRFKDPASGEDCEASAGVINTVSDNADVAFIACVEEFALLLRNSEYKGNADYDAVLARLSDMADYLAADEYKQEFVGLVRLAKEIG